MSAERPRRYGDYEWIVRVPELIGASWRYAARAFRYRSFCRVWLEQMTLEEIEETYAPLSREAIPEVLRVASELLDSPHVAA